MYYCLLHATDDIRVTRVLDAETADAIVATAGSAKLDVGALVVVDTDAGKMCVVLNLRAHQRRAVVREKNKLRLATTEHLQGMREAKAELATLHDELKT